MSELQPLLKKISTSVCFKCWKHSNEDMRDADLISMILEAGGQVKEPRNPKSMVRQAAELSRIYAPWDGRQSSFVSAPGHDRSLDHPGGLIVIGDFKRHSFHLSYR
jgi:hypothetical protein